MLVMCQCAIHAFHFHSDSHTMLFQIFIFACVARGVDCTLILINYKREMYLLEDGKKMEARGKMWESVGQVLILLADGQLGTASRVSIPGYQGYCYDTSFSILSPFHIMCSITWSAVSITQHCCTMPQGYHMLLCNTSLITHVEHSGSTYIRIPRNALLLTHVLQLVYIVSSLDCNFSCILLSYPL